MTANLQRWPNRDPLGETFDNNLFRFAYNDPLNYVDVNGLWSTKNWPTGGFHPVHQIAIDRALGFLPPGDRDLLKQAQVDADKKENQTPEAAPQHAVRDGKNGQTPQQARDKANKYVRDKLCKARADEAAARHADAMKELGHAIHAMQDATSPTHAGFRPWGGPDQQNSLAHVMGERAYPGDSHPLFDATGDAYRYFSGEFPIIGDFFPNTP